MVKHGTRAARPASRCRGDTVGESTQKKQGAVVSPLDLDQISGIHTEVLRAARPALGCSGSLLRVRDRTSSGAMDRWIHRPGGKPRQVRTMDPLKISPSKKNAFFPGT